MRKELIERIEKHNQITRELEAKGYSMQGCGNRMDKCYFASGKAPYQKIVGYIDNKTLEVIFL